MSTIIYIGNISNRTGGEPIDYYVAYASPNFVIVPEGRKYYILNITIVPDKRLEENELFRIYVDQPKSVNGMMSIHTDVIIMDDDSKLLP